MESQLKSKSLYVEIKCQLDVTDDFYCRSYCLLNMFRAPLCPSSGAREYYTSGCCLSCLVLWFSSCRYGVELRVVCPVWKARRNARTHAHTHTPQVHNMPPNTGHAQDKYLWTITSTSSQVQVITPWWWILCDPKYVGVIFNYVSFKLFTT